MWIRINPLVLCLLPVIFLLIEGRSRPCSDDRIVFPKDDDEESHLSKFTDPRTNSTTTTTEEPLTTVTTLLETTNTTEAISNGSGEELVNGTTTEKPTIDNRILLETSPKCRPGFELHAKRCRKPA
ncbi:uncharacterized protein LOC119549948 [Drosophila subpulchrella]|uniref:uncharacterized protein LOC119549948 n=1 Tax=Drosophila subpulchrella TaxID=1486046 RepID=UPI0018A1A034|nr:uncharacterized protein LOC119549948 [Drosophila subpulchrella]